MPLCSMHLLLLQPVNGSSKSPHANRAQFLQRLLSSSLGSRVLIACVVRRPVIVANKIDTVYLNATRWDLLLVLSPEKEQGSSFNLQYHPVTKADVRAEYALNVGIPSRILDAYADRTKSLNDSASKTERPSNQSLLSSPARTHPNYVPKTSQLLEMSEDLVDLIDELDELGEGDGLVDARGPVHQLNFLHFKTSKEDKERYYKYGQDFATVASQYGAEAKLLASVINGEGSDSLPHWDEVSLVHYPSLRQFAAMAASEGYQDINRKYRLPSLDDTTIICTQEVDLTNLRARAKAKM
ncbi:hypothetical protein CBS101457_006854 [Exobasidium rhododendri]|nr:hypothetical protein CBS101457_006854 [Exobasidium rhododendri]